MYSSVLGKYHINRPWLASSRRFRGNATAAAAAAAGACAAAAAAGLVLAALLLGLKDAAAPASSHCNPHRLMS
jgi:hypothetical protein